MKTVMYMISTDDAVVDDGFGTAGHVLHDAPGDVDGMRLRALVASGDYFATLAARLEQVAATLPETSVEQFQLQDAVGQLLVLQRDYAIARRTGSVRP
ncbi:MAG TPA: hypothetical protein VGM08_02435 [Candidatus Saccharimonadales bacterium]